MWLSDRRPGDLASAAIHLRTRIKKRSAKYSFYKPKNRRGGADAGSEKVDWVFVGFPSSNSGTSSTDLDNAPLTFEPLRRPTTSVLSTAPADLRPSASFTAAEQQPLPVQPLDPILTAAFNAEPPPLPPRAKNLNRRPPPPRPTSLYASLNRNVQIPNPTDEYAQVIRSGRRAKGQQKKRPRSSEAAVEAPPIPRHMHGTGVPVPLPDSPPAPPLPPHAIREPSPPPLPRFESLSRSIESPFYQRPMSLASSSLARSMSSSHLISSNHRNASLHIERSYDSVQATSSLEVQRRRSMKANVASSAAAMDMDDGECIELQKGPTNTHIVF